MFLFFDHFKLIYFIATYDNNSYFLQNYTLVAISLLPNLFFLNIIYFCKDTDFGIEIVYLKWVNAWRNSAELELRGYYVGMPFAHVNPVPLGESYDKQQAARQCRAGCLVAHF